MSKKGFNLLKNSFKNDAIQGKINDMSVANSGNIKATLEAEILKKTKKSKFFFIFAVIYTISPIDIIPDFIPVVGIIDDIIMWFIFAFIAINLKSLKKQRYTIK